MSNLLPVHQKLDVKNDMPWLKVSLFFAALFWGSYFFFSSGVFTFIAWVVAIVWFLFFMVGKDEGRLPTAFLGSVICGTGFLGFVAASVLFVILDQIKKAAGKDVPEVTANTLAEHQQLAGTFAGSFKNLIQITDPHKATLVLGPSGSGKSSTVLNPTVAIATGPVVCASVKWDALYSTINVRKKRGRIWALDLGGGIPEVTTRLHWSPLTGIIGWDSARVMASEWASPYLADAQNRHWIDAATDWLTILLFAGRNATLIEFAAWCREGIAAFERVEEALKLGRAEGADLDTDLATSMLQSIKSTPEVELASVAATLRRMTAVYSSTAALTSDSEEFLPEKFIHTSDTVYIAASSEEQKASAGLIIALLSAITREHKRAFNENQVDEWLNIVIDDAGEVAHPPLDSWASQFGGHGIALTVGLQDLSQARSVWPSVNFLGLFPSTILLPGIRDEQTLSTFSQIAGEFDRQMIDTNEGVIEEDRLWGDRHRQNHTGFNYRTERTRVVPVEAIAQMPQGEGMLWEGSSWKYIRTHTWDSEFFSHYKELVPHQWRDVAPQQSLMNRVTNTPEEELLRQAAQYQAQAEGKMPYTSD